MLQTLIQSRLPLRHLADLWREIASAHLEKAQKCTGETPPPYRKRANPLHGGNNPRRFHYNLRARREQCGHYAGRVLSPAARRRALCRACPRSCCSPPGVSSVLLLSAGRVLSPAALRRACPQSCCSPPGVSSVLLLDAGRVLSPAALRRACPQSCRSPPGVSSVLLLSAGVSSVLRSPPGVSSVLLLSAGRVLSPAALRRACPQSCRSPPGVSSVLLLSAGRVLGGEQQD